MIYKITKLFPDDERFGLISQMRRCVISISSNIAEGTYRHTAKDKARFTEIAYGSALELLNKAILSNDLEFLTNENYEHIRTELTENTVMLNTLRKVQIRT